MEEFRFYQTYYFCNAINNVLREQLSYAPKLNDFYGEERVFYFLGKFEKESIFHEFIEFVVSDIYEDNLENVDWDDSIELPIELAFKYYGLSYTTSQKFYSESGHHKHLDA